ncbi:MAG: DUF692 domain-containing protein [Reyranellaceae bacterium]
MQFGLGLRPQHYLEILDGPRRVDWFEAISENYMGPGGKPLHYVERIRADYPLALHGVSLSIGASDPLNYAYLDALKALAARLQPLWLSDHLCWTGAQGRNTHDLLPLPYTEEALAHVAERVQRVQEHLRRELMLENVSSYVEFAHSTMSEWEFIAELCRRTGCLLLLDVNNVHVSAFNHGFDAREFLAGIPAERVRQIHLAGHSDLGTHIVDTHDAPVADPVWRLYAEALRRFGAVPTMIERDDDIPPFAALAAELDTARRVARRTLRQAA